MLVVLPRPPPLPNNFNPSIFFLYFYCIYAYLIRASGYISSIQHLQNIFQVKTRVDKGGKEDYSHVLIVFLNYFVLFTLICPLLISFQTLRYLF